MRPTNFRYRLAQDQFADFDLTPSAGGDLYQCQAGATLNVGDVVQIGGTNIVTKATGNPTRVCGVVVGGASLQGDGNIFESDVTSAAVLIATSMVAAILGQVVFIMRAGVFFVVADGVIANAALLKQSGTTAGQVTSATADTDHGAIVGKLLDVASAVAGDVRRALIFLA